MLEDMQHDAIQYAIQAHQKSPLEKDIATFMKKEFDRLYQPTWHCVVGKNFGSYVTHEAKCFIYFDIGAFSVLLFKAGSG
jgi:dynein light chain LC8-type